MSTSTEICLADTRAAALRIRLASQLSPTSGTGNRLAHIGKKIQELVRVLEGEILTERKNHQ